MNLCGVILAGGKSTRMGTNKSFLQLDNKPVIEHIYEELTSITENIMVIANEHEQYKYLEVPIFQDRYMNKGPLAGIESALSNEEDADTFLFAACDMPFIQSEVYHYLLSELGSFDAVVPVFNDRVHPISAIYKKAALPAVQHQLEKNELKVMSFFDHIRVKYVRLFDGLSDEQLQQHFFNMNNPTQYKEAIHTYRLFKQ